MTQHMVNTLRKLSEGDSSRQSGWHFGTLKALVVRGLAETFRSEFATEYRVTGAGREALLRENRPTFGYEEQTDSQEREARAAYEAAPKPQVRICSECNEPIIDGDPRGHKQGCKTNADVEY